MPEIHVVQPPPQYHNGRKNYKAPIMGATAAGITAGIGGYLTANPVYKKGHIKDFTDNPDVIKEGATTLKELQKRAVDLLVEANKKTVTQKGNEVAKTFAWAAEIIAKVNFKEGVLKPINKALIVEKLKTAAIIAVPTAIVTGLAAGISANSKNK